MILNCLKCGKEITGPDIEGKKYYCSSCTEWFRVKEESSETKPKTEENNKRIRHKIVTIWIWLSIIANVLYVFFIFIGGIRINSEIRFFVVLFSFAIIISLFLLVRWKILGFFTLIVAFIISFYIIFVHNYYHLEPKMLLFILPLLICFGILNIRKNGTSTWRHLLNEAKTNKRKTIIEFAVVFGSVFAVLVLTAFPVKRIYGNITVLFAPERIARPDHYSGRLLGNHVLNTEFGEIKVKSLTNVTMFRSELIIYAEEFQNRSVSHNLEFGGIDMPKDITVWIYIGRDISEITLLDIREEKIRVSGITVIHNTSQYIDVNDSYEGRSVSFPIIFEADYITLEDSTRIDVRMFSGYFEMYFDKEQWELRVPEGGWFSIPLKVTLPGETEPARYWSVTFKQNWGAFIKGKLYETD